jgi:hypothetical protein
MPHRDRDPGELRELHGLPGVARRLLEESIAEDRRDGAQIQYASLEEEGHDIVMPRIAVDDGGWFHACTPIKRCR